MPEKTKFDFKKSYAKLQEIVHRFDRGDLDVEQSLKWFEEGMGLVAGLKQYVETMEHKIKELKKNYN